MKKITLFVTLLISALGYSQTFAVYTQDPSIGTGVTVTFANANAFLGFAPDGTANYEGSSHMLFPYASTAVGSDSWFMAQATGAASDLSTYGYYNIALKTSSPNAFYLRLKGSGGARVLFTPGAFPYGFNNDGQWHFMSIPVADFVQFTGTFNIAAVTDYFILRSFDASTLAVAGANNNFEVDNIYFSKNVVLGVNEFDSKDVAIYPNPAANSFKIRTTSSIDKITIYNSLGQKMLESSPGKAEANIDITSYKNGLYLIQVESEGKSMTQKLIKN